MPETQTQTPQTQTPETQTPETQMPETQMPEMRLMSMRMPQRPTRRPYRALFRARPLGPLRDA